MQFLLWRMKPNENTENVPDIALSMWQLSLPVAHAEPGPVLKFLNMFTLTASSIPNFYFWRTLRPTWHCFLSSSCNATEDDRQNEEHWENKRPPWAKIPILNFEENNNTLFRYSLTTARFRNQNTHVWKISFENLLNQYINSWLTKKIQPLPTPSLTRIAYLQTKTPTHRCE